MYVTCMCILYSMVHVCVYYTVWYMYVYTIQYGICMCRVYIQGRYMCVHTLEYVLAYKKNTGGVYSRVCTCVYKEDTCLCIL